MLRRTLGIAVVLAGVAGLFGLRPAQAQQRDWDRFYHYPYIYYPQNFWGPEYYKGSNDLYFRYPPELRIPVYNKQWYNYYPEKRKYHHGKHFILDVF